MRRRNADEQTGWRDLLTAHREQLREWAENYPPTFADKHVAGLGRDRRLEERDADAMRLYEQAIHSAREHGFVQNEGLAHEVAARFYLARGFETIAHTYLRNARNCYERWGALGKVKQLDERYPRLLRGTRSYFDYLHSWHAGRPVGRRDCSQGVTGNLKRDGSQQADPEAYANRGGARRGRAESAHPSARG